MHVNTATNCRSRYTVDAELILECSRPVEKHGNGERVKHMAPYEGFLWTWSDAEADRWRLVHSSLKLGNQLRAMRRSTKSAIKGVFVPCPVLFFEATEYGSFTKAVF